LPTNNGLPVFLGVGWRIGIHRRCIVSWQVYEYTSWQGQLLVDELTNKQVYKVACMAPH